MRSLVFALALVLAACANDPAPPAAEPAQVGVDAAAAGDHDLGRFLDRFQAAVRDGDRAGVLALSDFSQGTYVTTEQEFLDGYADALLDRDSPVRARVLAASADELTPGEDGRQTLEVYESEEDEAGNTLYESVTILYFGQNAAGQYRLVDVLVAG